MFSAAEARRYAGQTGDAKHKAREHEAYMLRAAMAAAVTNPLAAAADTTA